MNTNNWLCRVLLASLATVSLQIEARGQYYDSRVVEKSFDRSDVFFAPSYLNPYGFEGFGSVAPGFISNQFLDLELNPAALLEDSVGSSSLYLDFRQSRRQQQFDYCAYCMYVDYAASPQDAFYLYPYYPQQQAPEPEPLFASGFAVRPSTRLALGGSYQLLFVDSGYFGVPADIYRSSASSDFLGNQITDAAPVTEIRGGEDAMRTVGHEASVFGATIVGPLSVGARLGATLYDRNGDQADHNTWMSGTRQISQSIWRNEESRNVDYNHLEGELGARLEVVPGTNIGAAIGYLVGTADQNLSRRDSSAYLNGTPSSVDYSRHLRGGQTIQSWNHEGNSYWGTVTIHTNLTASTALSALYHLEKSDIDLTVDSAVRDTSNSAYRYEFDNYSSESTSFSSVSDMRAGTGVEAGTRNRVGFFATWSLDGRSTLSLGVDINSRLRTVNTSENVRADLLSSYSYNYSGSADSTYYALSEQKLLEWDFRTRTTVLSFPVHFQSALSDRLVLELGVNRRLVLWNTEDVTTALFDYRSVTEGETTTRRENFGERYREPTDRQSEVRTSFLAGLTFSPNESMAVRFLVAPEYYRRYAQSNLELRWWVGLTFHR
ncbi:MAG: hypothetical protein KDD65_02500 [Bacteroidetes bacterium]|nr:hypothetical protein [Bacteroidota bacterium]